MLISSFFLISLVFAENSPQKNLANDLEKISELSMSVGDLQRWENLEDPREYRVKWIPREGESTWIEISEPEQEIRADEAFREAYRKAPRIFDSACNAVANIRIPTALEASFPQFFLNIGCSNSLRPITKKNDLEVFSSRDENAIECLTSLIPLFCAWKTTGENEKKALAQASAFYFLSRLNDELQFKGLHLDSKPLRAFASAFSSNRSFYNAEDRTFYFGEGEYADALDGFIVSHERTHALIDDLNPKMFGYGAQMIHEGLSDFWPADIYRSACIAPYEAQEVEGRKCMRSLSNHFKIPDDLKGDDSHFDSQILSGALWDFNAHSSGRADLKTSILETLIRLPKNPDLSQFWDKLTQVLKDRKQAKASDFELLQTIRTERGF